MESVKRPWRDGSNLIIIQRKQTHRTQSYETVIANTAYAITSQHPEGKETTVGEKAPNNQFCLSEDPNNPSLQMCNIHLLFSE